MPNSVGGYPFPCGGALASYAWIRYKLHELCPPVTLALGKFKLYSKFQARLGTVKESQTENPNNISVCMLWFYFPSLFLP